MRANIIATLRDLVPIRPLTKEESLRIAELQAHRFHELVGLTEPPLPERVISELPRLQLERMSPMPVSGSTHWASSRWLIMLNGAEPLVRQRFSLAHEFKHILDHRFVDVLYPGSDRAKWIEQVCDFFAGCLLMPRPWLKRLYASGIQGLPELATRFEVSQAAMYVRLNQVGLIVPAGRCAGPRPNWAISHLRAQGISRRYRRSPAAALG